MSVLITIDDDGHIEATHNSGEVLWSVSLDESFCPYATDSLDEEIAWWLNDAIWPYDASSSR